MQKKDCFLVGTVFKLHGYKGDVKIYNDNKIIFNFDNINFFLIEKENTLIPFFIIDARTTKSNIILTKFEDINSEKEALSILKSKVYLPINLLPKINQESYNQIQLIDFKVLDVNLGKLGVVSYINTQTAQKLIYVRQDEKEFCFPMHEEFIFNIDTKNKTLKVSIPEELINLN